MIVKILSMPAPINQATLQSVFQWSDQELEKSLKSFHASFNNFVHSEL